MSIQNGTALTPSTLDSNDQKSKADSIDSFEEHVNQLERADTTSIESPAERGSDSLSGSTPDPASDDDVLQNAHQVGIAPDADLDNPTELNIAQDVADAEEYHKHH